jgi:hypothetical protein
MDVGQPQREIIVEPLELPEPLRERPQQEPDRAPAHQPQQPQQEPAHV